MNQITPATALYTASEFTLSEEVVETIDLYMGERIIKQNPSVTVPTDKTLSKVIDLTGADDGKLTMMDTEKVWMICYGFRLTMRERQNILNGGCLTDRIINAACAILRKQFPGYGGYRVNAAAAMYQRAS